MNRRGFLRSIGAAIAGAAVDPENLGWVKGERVWSIPRALVIGPEYPVGLITPKIYAREALAAMERRFVFMEKEMTREELAAMFPPAQAIAPKCLKGLSNLSRPPRFIGQLGPARPGFDSSERFGV